MSGLSFEARQLGWPAVVAAPFAVSALAFLGLLAQALGAGGQTNRVLSAIAQVASLVGGIAAVSAVAVDPAVELRLSLPLGLQRSFAIRLTLALVWCGIVMGAATLVLHALGRFTFEIEDSAAADQLVWLPPVMLLAGVGAAATVVLRSSSAGAGIVAVGWVLSNVLGGLWQQVPLARPLWLAMPYDSADAAAWYWNRATLTVGGLLLLGVTAVVLGRGERLLGADR